MSEGVELSDYIKSLRQELSEAIEEGQGSKLKFIIDDLTLELVVAGEKSTKLNGGVSFKVLSLFNASVGADKGSTHTNSQKITLKLKPISSDGDIIPMLE